MGAVFEGGTLEAPVLLGEKMETVGFGVFSKTSKIFFGRKLPMCGERQLALQPACSNAYRLIATFQRVSLL